MRVFARTARPIGGVQIQTPVVARDFTRAAAPINVSIDATLTDAAGATLAGAVPVQVRLVDPLGSVPLRLVPRHRDGHPAAWPCPWPPTIRRASGP